MHSFQPDISLFFLDGSSLFEEFSNQTSSDAFSLIQTYAKQNPSIKVVINTIDVIQEKPLSLDSPSREKQFECQWNESIHDESIQNLFQFDFKELVSIHGRDQLYSSKGWILGNIRLSNTGTTILHNSMETIIRIVQEGRKKCLVLDLDNTLWGGVIGEDGMNGIMLNNTKEGSQYYRFQKMVKNLSSLGVLLAICSKNNELDAMEVFHCHPYMLLKPEDFVTMKINWNSKTDNIKAIARELNIGLNSLVFIDDSPFERDLVKSQLPEVCVPDVPADSTKIPSWFYQEQKKYFTTLHLTEEDQKKTEMYHSQKNREEQKKRSSSLEEYLSSLHMVLDFRTAKESDIPRVVQLLQKTNQFNVATKRYTEREVKQFLANSSYWVYIASLKDRFGDNGKVAVVIVKLENDSAIIDSFLMSCRVMGRMIENHIITVLEQHLKKQGITSVYASYIPTQKNKPVAQLWDSLGYSLLQTASDGTSFYRVDLTDVTKRKYFSEYILRG